MNAKIKMLQYVIYMKPRIVDTADIKCKCLTVFMTVRN